MPVEIRCDFCGDTVSKPPSVVERADHHFCDKSCYGRWQSEQKDSRITLECDSAGRSSNDTRSHSGTIRQTISVATSVRESGTSTIDLRQNARTVVRRLSEFNLISNHLSVTSVVGSASGNGSRRQPPTDWKSTPNYGPLWKERREQTLERDNRTCQACGRTEDDLGYTPRVHHIQPFSVFNEEEIETAHDLSNLVSLCEPCHTKWEGIPLRPKLI